MTSLAEALVLLGLTPGQTLDEARVRYRELLLRIHPDVAGADTSVASATTDTIAATSAFAAVRDAVAAHDGVRIPQPPVDPDPPASDPDPDCRHRSGPAGPIDTIEISADGDTLFLTAPPAEVFGILLDAGSRLGGIGYVDRQLGLLEIIVRFEGGPSCSVLITLQGRAFGTDAFITMESIEADPTPPLAPVIEALLEELVEIHSI